MPQALELGTNTLVEVISAYAATNQELPGVALAPAWVVVGAFYMPFAATVKLEIVGSVTDAALEMQGRLFDVVGAAPVSGSTTEIINGTVDERQVSGVFDLPGGKVYQMQAQVIGDPGESGLMRCMVLV